eukprot:TRINITY_DN4572_c0_g1_i1.p1 TRINITY_DN4572_c0_g1~~TRINITY_DN4572_c0_g1_i1.p1  ORF type:complete len:894 (+),score=270.07 TRINITY_DN4572_c0_g1_i1:169-2850(+)
MAPRGVALLAATAAWCARGAEAGGGVSIFLFGKEIDKAPWPVFAMYIMVIIVSVFYELLTHYIDHQIKSASGKSIVAHIYKEVMILGGISLLLTVLENTAGELVFPPAFYHYVHFVIFFMALNLIFCVSLLFLFISKWWTHWEFFEMWTSGIENDPRWSLEERQSLITSFVSRYQDGGQMLSCLLFYRSNLPDSLRNIQFSRYMRKQQRKALLSILDLHASAWSALAFLVLLVALQNHITASVLGNDGTYDDGSGSGGSATATAAAAVTTSTTTLTAVCRDAIDSLQTCGYEAVATAADDSGSGSGSGGGDGSISEYELIVMLLFVGIEGYGVMFIVAIFYFAIVRKSYRDFTENIEALRLAQRLTPMVLQKTYFLRQKPALTLSLMQAMLLCQVFYLATITCNYAPRWLAGDVTYSWGWVIFVVSLPPPIITTTGLLPKLMPVYTILTSVGDLLDVSTIQSIKSKDDASGMYRRLALRKRATTAPPPYFDEPRSPLDAYVKALMLREEELNIQNTEGMPGAMPGSPGSALANDREIKRVNEYYESKQRALKHGGGDHHGHGGAHGPARMVCDECGDQYAHVQCGVCGLLCRHCDLDYHKLKRHRGHLVIPLNRSDGHDHVHPVLLKMGQLTCDLPMISDPPDRTKPVPRHKNATVDAAAVAAAEAAQRQHLEPPVVMTAPDMPSFSNGAAPEEGHGSQGSEVQPAQAERQGSNVQFMLPFTQQQSEGSPMARTQGSLGNTQGYHGYARQQSLGADGNALLHTQASSLASPPMLGQRTSPLVPGGSMAHPPGGSMAHPPGGSMAHPPGGSMARPSAAAPPTFQLSMNKPLGWEHPSPHGSQGGAASPLLASTPAGQQLRPPPLQAPMSGASSRSVASPLSVRQASSPFGPAGL